MYKKILGYCVLVLLVSMMSTHALNARSISSQDIQLHLGDTVYFGSREAKTIWFGGYGQPECRLAISTDGQYFYLTKMHSTCTKYTNSSGVKIICNSNKSVCKTRKELISFMFNTNIDNPYWCRASNLNNTELAICSSATLSRLDQELASVYGAVKADGRDHGQINWLRNQRNACGSNNYCIEKAYNNRIEALRGGYTSYGSNSTNVSRSQHNPIQALQPTSTPLISDSINRARVDRAKSEHASHAKRVSSNQLEFSQKKTGIRPKSDLDATDGNINAIKIQYYIPGSEEIGEMWADWHVDDEKGPVMVLHFIDPTHKYEKEAHTINISLLPIDSPCNTDINIKSTKETSPSCKIVKDLLIVDKWAKIAKTQEMKRRYTKRVSFVTGDEKSKKSLGVNFQIYENGAMVAQIEEINHGFPKRFNFTLTQALELARYIENTRKKSHKKWMNKTRTKEDLDALFN